jgi:uncharacterized membrane protein YbhN (UPF0104 family)
LKKLNWKLLAKVAFTIVAVSWVISKIDLTEVGKSLAGIPVAISIFALVIFNISKVVTSVRLNIFFRQEGVVISEKENLKLYYKGMFYNMLLPGGIGGDGFKGFYLHNKLQVPVKNLVRPLLWDRITGAVGIGLLILVLINFQTAIPLDFELKILMACSPLLAYVAGWIGSNIIIPTYKHVFHSTTALSLLNQLIQGFVIVLLLWGLNIPLQLYDEYLLVFFISSLATILPITLGGVGIREFVFLKAAQISEIEQNTAIALSVLFFTIGALSSMAGSVVKMNIQSAPKASS